ncbi:uncharacterized protein N7500_005926 [Penicillium coprophilum]|uniref:uncharacterized protein n=1 Tax=Penicillium coprophilum TaxID=36646 RepID=UPI002382C3D1|nr:uncharacterized protein N7500_005926 [Penicillium coprophilum]KAJ5164096.1 hypothetical protein N7500_005926 [Penicillium coprophilum]
MVVSYSSCYASPQPFFRSTYHQPLRTSFQGVFALFVVHKTSTDAPPLPPLPPPKSQKEEKKARCDANQNEQRQRKKAPRVRIDTTSNDLIAQYHPIAGTLDEVIWTLTETAGVNAGDM